MILTIKSAFRAYARVVILAISKRLCSGNSLLIINLMEFSRRIGSILKHLLHVMVELLCCLVALICLLLDRCFLQLLNLLLNATDSFLDKGNLLAYKLSLCSRWIRCVLLGCSGHAMQLLWRNNLSLDRMLEMLFDWLDVLSEVSRLVYLTATIAAFLRLSVTFLLLSKLALACISVGTTATLESRRQLRAGIATLVCKLND